MRMWSSLFALLHKLQRKPRRPLSRAATRSGNQSNEFPTQGTNQTPSSPSLQLAALSGPSAPYGLRPALSGMETAPNISRVPSSRRTKSPTLSHPRNAHRQAPIVPGTAPLSLAHATACQITCIVFAPAFSSFLLVFFCPLACPANLGVADPSRLIAMGPHANYTR